MKAFDRWYSDRASLALDYQVAQSFWKAARKNLKRKIQKLQKQLKRNESTSVRTPDI